MHGFLCVTNTHLIVQAVYLTKRRIRKLIIELNSLCHLVLYQPLIHFRYFIECLCMFKLMAGGQTGVAGRNAVSRADMTSIDLGL